MDAYTRPVRVTNLVAWDPTQIFGRLMRHTIHLGEYIRNEVTLVWYDPKAIYPTRYILLIPEKMVDLGRAREFSRMRAREAIDFVLEKRRRRLARYELHEYEVAVPTLYQTILRNRSIQFDLFSIYTWVEEAKETKEKRTNFM